MNKVILIGRLARDPELRYTPSNIPVCRLTIAVDRRFKSENQQQTADFITVLHGDNKLSLYPNTLKRENVLQ